MQDDYNANIEKRLQYLEGKEAERTTEKQKWIDYGIKRAEELRLGENKAIPHPCYSADVFSNQIEEGFRTSSQQIDK